MVKIWLKCGSIYWPSCPPAQQKEVPILTRSAGHAQKTDSPLYPKGSIFSIFWQFWLCFGSPCSGKHSRFGPSQVHYRTCWTKPTHHYIQKGRFFWYFGHFGPVSAARARTSSLDLDLLRAIIGPAVPILDLPGWPCSKKQSRFGPS